MFVSSHPKLAKLFKVSTDAIKKWQAAGAPAKRGTTGYSVPDWIEWRMKVVGRDRGADVEASTRLKQARAGREELRLQRESNAIVSKAAVERHDQRVVAWMISAFERAGSELQSKTAGKKPGEVKKVIDRYFADLRAKLASTPADKCEPDW